MPILLRACHGVTILKQARESFALYMSLGRLDRIAALMAIVPTILMLVAPSSGATMEWDTDLPGQDYRTLPLDYPAPSLCRDECEGDPKCRAWTFMKPGVQGSTARCWLKHSVPSQVPNSCCVSGVKTRSTAPAVPTSVTTQTFKQPMIWGYRLDWCRELGHDCGKPAADEFCRLNSFDTSTGHLPERHIGARSPTLAITSGEICSRPDCDGFLSITCKVAGEPPILPPSPTPPIEGPHVKGDAIRPPADRTSPPPVTDRAPPSPKAPAPPRLRPPRLQPPRLRPPRLRMLTVPHRPPRSRCPTAHHRPPRSRCPTGAPPAAKEPVPHRAPPAAKDPVPHRAPPADRTPPPPGN